MWFRRRTDFRIGLCPDRLVTEQSIHATSDPISELRSLAKGKRATLVLSNHFFRYAVLPWSPALKSTEQWTAFARHSFSSTYGAIADGWSVIVSANDRGGSRVACAIDKELLQSLRAIPEVVSLQPYLMAAFNRCRRALKEGNAWFVVQEPSRLTLGLIAQGGWRTVRVRRVGADWQRELPELIDRETLAGAEPGAERVVLWCEEDAPKEGGRYSLDDLTLPRGTDAARRQHAMALH